MQKMGASTKQDAKTLREHLPWQTDSPPLTPKSVRPALSPIVESELRSACAYILQNFKPSHIAFEEQHGAASQRPQLDYAAIKESVHKEMEAAAPPPLTRKTTGTGEVESGSRAPARSDSVKSERYRYKADTATDDLFRTTSGAYAQPQQKHAHTHAISRADALMEPARSPPPQTRERSASHLRSVSVPMQPASLAPNPEPTERPWIAQRSDSVETTGSTPKTDTTEDQWSETKASTAMTSAVLTPARSSKRTSTQAMLSGSESSSMPKGEQTDVEWMRQEREKRKKAQEGVDKDKEDIEEGADASTTASDITPTQQSTQSPTPVRVPMPTRKPVPGSRSGSRPPPEAPRFGGRQSAEQSRPGSRHARERSHTSTGTAAESIRMVPPPVRQATQPVSIPSRTRSVRREVQEYLRPGSRQDVRSENPPSGDRSRSVTRQVKDYIRSSSRRALSRPRDDGSRQRSGSVSRNVKEYFRPSAMNSRKPSVDLVRDSRRSRSIDSFRTGRSEFAPSTTLSGGNLSKRTSSWRPFHRSPNSQGSPDTSRPGTSGGDGTDTRGRHGGRDTHHSPQPSMPNAKANALDLNRRLPPLPGLDKWKDAQAENAASRPGTAIPRDKAVGAMGFKAHRAQRSREQSAARRNDSDAGDRDEIIAARMGMPSSRKPSMDVRSTPLPPSAPPPPPPHAPNTVGATTVALGATMLGPEDFDYEHLTPSPSIEQTDPFSDVKKQRRRSKSMAANFPSDPKGTIQDGTFRQQYKDTSLNAKVQVVNFSRAAAGAMKGTLSRKNSRVDRTRGPPKSSATPPMPATTGNTPISHSRTNSDAHQLSRKLSMDNQMQSRAGRYQNIVPIDPAPHTPPQLVTNGKEAKGKKWWQRKEKRSPSWMDAVVSSGSNSGMIVVEEAAGSPVVRY